MERLKITRDVHEKDRVPRGMGSKRKCKQDDEGGNDPGTPSPGDILVLAEAHGDGWLMGDVDAWSTALLGRVWALPMVESPAQFCHERVR